MTLEIRKAVASDQPHIVALVRSERLNPTKLDWRNFRVAVLDGRLVGAVQIRPHASGAREVGSFVVAHALRGSAFGARLLDHLLTDETTDLYAITVSGLEAYCSAWGFRREPAFSAPLPIVLNAVLGQVAGFLAATFRGRELRRVVILRRPADTQPRVPPACPGAERQPHGEFRKRALPSQS